MGYYTNLCEARGIRLLVVADLDEIFDHPVAVFEEQGLCLISLREEPLQNPISRFFKRCLDIAVSSFVLLFVLPICSLVVWCMQRLQSPGPLFYLQTRPGSQNCPFNIYKFRTLHVGNPDVNRLPGPEDPRVYPAGRLFRKFSVDEIPQFWNVLRGDMSVVGPRPHLTADNERFPRLFNKAYVRAYVKPGITGLAQARGFRGAARTPEEIVRRIESDIEYLENWSFSLDCWLILRTALQMVIPPKSAV
jgi:putative colanic acid biosynthesis UDP-glucose lipid carrier transferase